MLVKPPAVHPGLPFPSRHRPLVETEGRHDRPKRTAVSQKRHHRREYQFLRLVHPVKRGAFRGTESAGTPFASVAALFLAVDHDVPFTFASVDRKSVV